MLTVYRSQGFVSAVTPSIIGSRAVIIVIDYCIKFDIVDYCIRFDVLTKYKCVEG